MEEHHDTRQAPPLFLSSPSPNPQPGYGSRLFSHLRSSVSYSLFWSEASGALGDLGTFVPIVIALTLVNGLDLGTTLLFTGLYNIVTGLFFGVPMPVQPMKSIAAVAIAQSSRLSIPEIMAAGITTASLLFVLGVTGLMGFVHNVMPLPVVRGIQLSQGLSFGNTAVKYVLKKQDFAHDKTLGDRNWFGLDGMLLALVAFGFVVVVTGSGDSFAQHSGGGSEVAAENRPVDLEVSNLDANIVSDGNKGENGRAAKFWKKLERIPTAVVVFLLGIVLAFIRKPSIWKELSVGPSTPHLVRISREDWKKGFLKGAIPQIPLSILNSVIAVCKLSSDLFPDKHVSPTIVSTSVGLMNLVGCWFGAMPVCHGAGGLAGQCRFGARSGAAVIMLGVAKLLLSLLLGSSLVKILTEFPIALLGTLLIFSGVELAMACRDQTSRLDAFVMLVCTVVSLGSANAALGFGSGLVLYVILKARQPSWWIGLKQNLGRWRSMAGTPRLKNQRAFHGEEETDFVTLT